MTIRRKTYKIPVFRGTIVPYFFDISNTETTYYRMDVFYDDTWNINTQRPTISHFAGAGLNSPYVTDSSMVAGYVNKGWIFAVTYYYQSGFVDPNWSPEDEGETGDTTVEENETSTEVFSPATTKTLWNEAWGENRNYYHHLMGRAYMIQSALQFIVDNLTALGDVNVNLQQIYFTGKSRGGVSLIIWSALSNTNNFGAYSSYVKAIINSCGFVGSATVNNKPGWIDFRNTINCMTHHIQWSQHKFFHVYNDQDGGDYDMAMRLMYAIPSNRLFNQYFMNFTDKGHETVMDFNVQILEQLINGSTSYVYNDLTLLNQEEQLKVVQKPKEYTS